MAKTSFSGRVWERLIDPETGEPNGLWASREPTSDDLERRRQWRRLLRQTRENRPHAL